MAYEKTYDTKCYALAEAFLDDFERMTVLDRQSHAHNIAQLIQSAIEDYIQNEIVGDRPVEAQEEDFFKKHEAKVHVCNSCGARTIAPELPCATCGGRSFTKRDLLPRSRKTL
jgi:hypothetical protein